MFWCSGAVVMRIELGEGWHLLATVKRDQSKFEVKVNDKLRRTAQRNFGAGRRPEQVHSIGLKIVFSQQQQQ